MWGSGSGQLGTKAHYAICAGWRRKPVLTLSSGARKSMDCDHRTGPHGRRWMIRGGGDTPWKGKVGWWLFGTRWRISLSPWIGPWLGWGSMLESNRMPWVYAWDSVSGRDFGFWFSCSSAMFVCS